MRSLSFDTDIIGIHGIRAYGRHGADPGERDQPQPFDIELELELDLARARCSDELVDTINYAHVHARVIEVVTQTSFALLERLGEELLRMLMADPRVCAARVSLSKPGFLDGATPTISLRAGRDDAGR